MPRYRFRWDNVDPDLLAALTAGAELDGRSAADWLRSVYGARPRPQFVAERWPVLRDRWLAEAGPARTTVVEALRHLHLGDPSIDTSTDGGARAYLHTCRNQRSLRAVVLDEFIRRGEQDPQPFKPSAEVAPTWEEFAGSLTTALQALAPGQYLILSVRGTGTETDDGRPGSAYFVQFADGGDRGLRAEAVANAYLAGAERLAPARILRLVELGWQPPTFAPGDPFGPADEHGSPNFFRDWDQRPVPHREVADLACLTLREIYGADTPAFLQFAAFDDDGAAITLPPLGIAVERPPPRAPWQEAELPTPDTPQELRDHLMETLADLVEGDELQIDEDGDIPIRWGSTALFARVGDDAPVVRLFAPILRDLAPSTSLLEAVNDINQHYLMLKAIWDGSSVILTVDVSGCPYVGAHVIEALTMLGAAADELDDELQEEFGGRTFFAPRPPAAGPTEDTGGYL